MITRVGLSSSVILKKNYPIPVGFQEAAKPAERRELPANHEQLHPSMLLAIMRPQTQYMELGSEGTTPNVIHRVGVTVDGQDFVGAARSKKGARKAAAIKACNAVFPCAFVAEPEPVPAPPKSPRKAPPPLAV